MGDKVPNTQCGHNGPQCLVEIGVKPEGIPTRKLGIWTSLRPKRLQNEVCDAHAREVLDQGDQASFWMFLTDSNVLIDRFWRFSQRLESRSKRATLVMGIHRETTNCLCK